MAALTEWDRRLLARHLEFYRALHAGLRQPTTAAQRHFVAVFQTGAVPRTQHEIAYQRHLQRTATAGQTTKPNTPEPVQEAVVYAEVDYLPPGPPRRGAGARPTTSRSSASAEDQDLRAEQAIDAIEEIELAHRLGRQTARLFASLKTAYRMGHLAATRGATDLAIWIAPLTADPGWSSGMRAWMGESFNTLSNAYTQAMDREWPEGIAPSGHRLFDGGHTILGSFERARGALSNDTLPVEIWQWMRAYASDFASPAGMPLVTLTKETYDTLDGMLRALGIPAGWTLDALTMNLEELIAAMVPGLAVLLNWSNAERADFHRSLGSLAVAAGISASPLGVLVLVVGAARVFHESRRGAEGAGSFARAFSEGGVMSGVVVSTGALVGGPVWVGMVAGIVLAMMLRRTKHRVDPVRLADALRDLLVTFTISPRPRAASP